jgi:flagellar motor switch protein FliN/FliY
VNYPQYSGQHPAAEQAAYEGVDVAPLSELEGGAAGGGGQALDALLDVSLPVIAEFGRTTMTVQEVLALGTGSVIPLSRIVGEPIDLYVADRKFAEGEVVVIAEHFGVRITRILSSSSQSGPSDS